jgi:hypothetical protein
MTRSIESKVKQALKFAESFFLYRLLWGRNFHYKHDPKLIDVGWNKVQTYGTFCCPIRFLRAQIATKKGKILMKIEQTPHYGYIKSLVEDNVDSSAQEAYRQHIETFSPKSIPERELEKTAKLVKSIVCDPDFVSKDSIVTYPPKKIKGTAAHEVRIYDGVHRASIAKAMGYKYIQCRIR